MFAQSYGAMRRRRHRKTAAAQLAIVGQLEQRCLLTTTLNPLGDFSIAPSFVHTDTDHYLSNGQRTWFQGTLPWTGAELWVTDHTQAGTKLLTDMNGTPESSWSRPVGHIGNDVLFVTSDTEYGPNELWLNDGTAGGTVRLSPDVWGTETGRRTAVHFVTVGAGTWFTARGPQGIELWFTGGSPSDTHRVLSSNEAKTLFDGAPTGMLYGAIGSRLILPITSNQGPVSLQSLDVSNLAAAPELIYQGGEFRFVQIRGDNLYFFARADPLNGPSDLWQSDGTSGGSRAIARAPTATSLHEGWAIQWNDQDNPSYVLSIPREPSEQYSSIWVTDVLNNPEVPYRLPGSPAFSSSSHFTALGDVHLFQGRVAGEPETVLWRLDVRSGELSRFLPGSTPELLILSRLGTVNGRYLVDAVGSLASGERFSGIWGVDDEGGAHPILRHPDGTSHRWIKQFEFVGERAYLTTTSGHNPYRDELWTTDGTAAGTHFLYWLSQSTVDSSSVTTVAGTDLGIFGSDLYPPQEYPGSLWLVDADGLVRQIAMPAGLHPNSTPLATVAVNSQRGLMFLATAGMSLFHLNFETNTASLVPGHTFVEQPPGVLHNGWYYFIQEAAPGLQLPAGRLYRTNGEGVPELVPNWSPGSGFRAVDVIRFQNDLMIVSADSDGGGSLWRFDETTSDTHLVSKLDAAGQAYRHASLFRTSSEKLLIRTSGSDWYFDGHAVRRAELDNFEPMGSSNMIADGRFLSFRYGFPSHYSYELWVTDGSPAGTRAVFEGAENPVRFGRVTQTITLDNRMYFVDGGELWVTNGTPDGTQRLQAGLFNLRILGQLHSQIAFSASHPDTGIDTFWVTDGTTAGTRLLLPEPQTRFLRFSPPQLPAAAGSAVIFSGDAGPEGREPWLLTTDHASVPPAGLHWSERSGVSSLEWSSVFGAVRYEVELESVLGGSWRRGSVHTTAGRESLLYPDLTDGAYRARVRAFGSDDLPTAWSGWKTLLVGAVPGFTNVPETAVDSVRSYEWLTPHGAVTSEVWISDLDQGTRAYHQQNIYSGDHQKSQLYLSQRLPPSRYGFWVRVNYSDGSRSEWSQPQIMNLLSTDTVSVRITSARDTGTLTAEWDQLEGADSWEVVLTGTGSGKTIQRSVVPAETLAGQFQDLPGDTYTVWVRARRNGHPFSVWHAAPAALVARPPQPRLEDGQILWPVGSPLTTYDLLVVDGSGTELINGSGLPGGTGKYVPEPPLPFGVSIIQMRAHFSGGSESRWSDPVRVESFRPVVMPLWDHSRTIDATPVIRWAGDAAEIHELAIHDAASGQEVYRLNGIRERQHRVSVPLSNGEYTVWVRGHYPDGSRSLWGPGRSLSIGVPPVASGTSSKISWTAVSGATHYELWIDYEGGERDRQVRIVHEQLLTGTAFTLPGNVPRGRYTAWVRAVRAEAGDLYRGRWSEPVTLLLSNVSGRDGGMDEFGMQAEEWSIEPPAAIPQLVDEPNRTVSRTPYATRAEDGEVAEESRNWDARVLESTDDVMTGVVMAEFAEHGFPREFINRP